MEGLLRLLGLENIHPAVAHFPIALLVIYSLLELIPFSRIREKLFLTKTILIGIGTISIIAVGETGEVASKNYTGEVAKIVSVHETLSLVSLIIFGTIFCIYALMIARKLKLKQLNALYSSSMFPFITHPYLRMVLAVAGITAISLTGTLGGAIVWGSTNDPFTKAAYELFFGK